VESTPPHANNFVIGTAVINRDKHPHVLSDNLVLPGEAAMRQPALLSTFFGKQTVPSQDLGVGLIKMLPPSQYGDFDSSDPQLERA
jgi:hypothetical protein